MTIPNGIASISTFGIIEAMSLWIATHSFGMLAMTDQDLIYIGAAGGTPVTFFAAFTAYNNKSQALP